jgi:hypothetical protein
MEKIKADLCIIGGGSGGFGAAIRAARQSRNRLSIVVVEQSGFLGGTSTIGGVNCWEPCISGPGIHNELYGSLSSNPMYAGMGTYTRFGDPKGYWWGMLEIDRDMPYTRGLRRKWTGRFCFEPEAMSLEMENLLFACSRLKIMYHTVFTDATFNGGRIRSVVVYSAEDKKYLEIEAALFIDCSGEIVLARACGCKTAIGEDARAEYNEPSAKETPGSNMNGVTQLFRVSPCEEPHVDSLPGWVENIGAREWAYGKKPDVNINSYPNGDLSFNILPVMEGNEYHRLPVDQRYLICRSRALMYWNVYQREVPGFDRYTFKLFSPKIGVRESYRLVGKYVLTEQDVRAGYIKQNRKEEIIAFCDHALDNHSDGEGLEEIQLPYGVPFSSLLANEAENLAVACRGASFSHIAASTCRLSRVMIAIGEAAGTAAAIAFENNKGFHEVDVGKLRSILKIPEFTEKIEQEREYDVVNI